MFVCAENAGRSQMAEAFFNTLATNTNFIAESAGTLPATTINPVVVTVMKEKGIDIAANTPKMFNPDTAAQYKRLISFGCLVKSTFTPDLQEKIEEWEIPDPKEKDVAQVREIRDAIEKKVRQLLIEIGIPQNH